MSEEIKILARQYGKTFKMLKKLDEECKQGKVKKIKVSPKCYKDMFTLVSTNSTINIGQLQKFQGIPIEIDNIKEKWVVIYE